jgi:hypothetical protein
MKYVDEACAWLILLGGIVHIVLTDLLHFRGSLDTALVWIFAAMLNLLRIRNGYSIQRLKISCVAANLSVMVLEAVRWKMFEGSSSLAVLALILNGVCIFNSREALTRHQSRPSLATYPAHRTKPESDRTPRRDGCTPISLPPSARQMFS